jgi:hypothetical protein
VLCSLGIRNTPDNTIGVIERTRPLFERENGRAKYVGREADRKTKVGIRAAGDLPGGFFSETT